MMTVWEPVTTKLPLTLAHTLITTKPMNETSDLQVIRQAALHAVVTGKLVMNGCRFDSSITTM